MALREGQRRDLGQTSTGMGHMYAQPLPFYLEIRKGAPLPPLLQHCPLVSTTSHYLVTSRSEHDRKLPRGPLANTLHSQAPPHWDTHFLNELAQRLRDSGSVRMVSVPISEQQDHYRGQAAPQGPLLDDYSTLLALHGQLDQAPATREQCVSTAHADYRRFSRSELAPPSGLEALPCYHSLLKSSAHSRLPPHKAPPTVACAPRLPRPPVPLPHGGRRSLYRDSFTMPAPHPAPSGPLPVPSGPLSDLGNVGAGAGAGAGAGTRGTKRGLIRDVLEVPKMYGTENQSYGGNRIVLV